MNKAFVKEPDGTAAPLCPRCGSLGQAVGPTTLGAHLTDAARRNLSDAAWFCPYARCEVAYFDLFDRVVGVETLAKPVYPKDPDAPICACFGFTSEEVEQDIREGGATRVRALVAKARSPEARCAVMAANGQSCIGEVQRYFMRLREAGQSHQS
jgi:hypothetical protein